MTKNYWKALLAVMFAVVLVTPQDRVSAAQGAAGAATPEAAISTLIKALHDPAAQGVACNALTGKVDDCPITARLRTRLQNPTGENGNIVSRSQNPPRSVSVAVIYYDKVTDPRIAHANVTWDNGTTSTIIMFVLVKEAGGWLVDDTNCGGSPETSIYNSPVGPCPSSIPSPVPNMPTTGAGEQLTLLIGVTVLALGLAVLGTELAWRRS